MKPPFARGPWAVAFVAAALCLVSQVGYSATLPVTPATFDAVLAKAAGGDVLSLSGAFGDLYVKKAVPVTLACAPGTTIRSMNINTATSPTVRDCAVVFTPTATTGADVPAVQIKYTTGAQLLNMTFRGGNAIAPNDVPGAPTGRAIYIENASGLLISNADIGGFDRGIVINGVAGLTVQKSRFHDLRRTAILGGALSDVTVDGNEFGDANPVNWGAGDHADFCAFWANPGQTTPNARVKITNNHMVGAEHQPVAAAPPGTVASGILGCWLQGAAPNAAEAGMFTDFEFTGNRMEIANAQGFATWGAARGTISSNTMTLAPGSTIAKNWPQVLLRQSTNGVSVGGNTLKAVDDQGAGPKLPGKNTIGINTLISDDMAAAFVKAGVPADVKPPPTVDPRDAQIADLTARLKASTDAQAATASALTTANATIGTLQGQLTASDMALKTAQDAQKATQAALDGAQAALAAKNAALAAIQSQAATAQAAH